MRYLSVIPIGATVIVLGACNASDRPVTTRSDGGTTRAPSGEAAADRDHSMIRVVNATGDANLTVVADEKPLFDAVGAKQVTPYKEIDENMVTFAVRGGKAVGGEAAKNREVLVDGQRYTAVILPDDKAATNRLRVLHDELTPDSGKARIRVINAAAGAGELDVALRGAGDRLGYDSRAGDTKAERKADSVAGRVSEGTQNAVRDATSGDLFDNLNYGSEGGFRDVDPASDASLVIRKDGQNRPLVSLTNIRLEPGTAYTFVVVGGDGHSYEIIRFEDKVGEPRHDVGVR